MRRYRSFSCASFPFALTWLAACGGTPPPVDAPKPAATLAEPGGPQAPMAPDLSPVSEPRNVVLLARANDPSKSIASIERLVKLSKPIRRLIDEAMSSEKAEFVSLNGSFDLAVALDPASSDKDPKFLWAVSIPVTSVEATLDRARKDGDDVRSTTVGAYRLKDKSTFCDVTPAPGDAPARVVCSDDEEALRELSAWLSRGVTTQPKKSADLWLRAEAAPLKEKYLPSLHAEADEGIAELMKEMRSAPVSLDPELLDVPNILAREAFALGDDTDSFEMAFTLDGSKPEVRTTMTLGFKSRTSWVTDLVARSAERPDPPPDMFFRLPKEAMTATWSRSADPSTFAGIRRVIHKSATTGLTLLPMIGDADRQAFVGWIDAIPSFSGMWVSSSGGGAPSKPAPKGKLTAAQAIEQAKETAKQWIPWGVAGGEGDASAMIAWLKQTEVAYGRAFALLKKEAGKNAAKDLALFPTMKIVSNVPGFPKGSVALDVDVKFSSKDVWELLPQNKFQEQPDGHWGSPEHPKGPEAHGNITLRILVVPEDAGHYWFGYAVDPDLLKKEMLAAQKGAPTSGTLASRSDLAILKGHRGFGGYLNYGTFLDPLRRASLSSSDEKELEEAVAVMPHKGQSPLFLLGSGTPGSSPTVTIDIVAPKDFVEDVAAVVQHYANKALDQLGQAPSPPAATTAATATQPPARKVARGKLPAECQQYLTKLDGCTKRMKDDATRKALQDSRSQTEDAWSQAAADPSSVPALQASCKAALDAVKQNPACK